MRDLLILGNGMAGMTAALYAKRANLNFKMWGMDEFNFGQICDAILVENYPASESLSGLDLAMKLHDQFGDEWWDIFDERMIDRVRRNSDGTFTVFDDDGEKENAKAIIYALGADYRKLPATVDPSIPVHYCALCDGPLYKDKIVAIIGGGDVAFTQAEYLSKICERVDIVMCDRNVTAASSIFQRVKNIENIDIVYDFPVDEITNNGYWTKMYSIRSDNRYLNVDGIFVAIGMMPNTAPLDDSSLNYVLNEQGYVIADEYGRTNCEGFFTIGDVRTKRVRQSITAAADGANAVQSVIDYLASEEND